MSKNKDLEYQKFWNSRYENLDFAYGKNPNLFFKQCIERLAPKSILMPADGEGRNGVFASKLGWEVTATDLSIEGKNKALQLAKENKVTLEYIIGDVQDLEFPKESFDAIGLIYAHFSGSKITSLHKKLLHSLRPKGTIIFEAYSKSQLENRKVNPNSGGPADIDMLFSKEDIRRDFPNFDIQILEEVEVELSEGAYHNGKASVIRFLGTKI